MSVKVGKLYKTDFSPPCRAVMVTAEALNINLDLVELNLFKREHMKPDFLKLNPNHAIPTYVDNDGIAIADSHVIMAYLVSKYGKDDSFYPKDLTVRAAVDQRLYFDTGSVFGLYLDITRPMYRKMATKPSQMQEEIAASMYTTLNRFLASNNWVAGTATPTIADFSLATSIGAISVVAPYDKQKFGNIEPWIKRCEALPYFNVNKKGADIYTSMLTDLMNNKHDFMIEMSK